MKSESWLYRESIDGIDFEPVEVLYGLKQIAMVIKFKQANGDEYAIYRPEDGLKISIDDKIPIPRELYLDCSFSQMCRLLGWDFVPPVYSWSLSSESKGVIRPYWKHVDQIPKYSFRKEYFIRNNFDFWKKIAVADYIFGVADRVSNDFLITNEGVMVVDSGYSFLPELDFSYQHSVVRDVLKGESISGDDLLLYDLDKVFGKLDKCEYLTEENKFWVTKRTERVINLGVII